MSNITISEFVKHVKKQMGTISNTDLDTIKSLATSNLELLETTDFYTECMKGLIVSQEEIEAKIENTIKEYLVDNRENAITDLKDTDSMIITEIGSNVARECFDLDTPHNPFDDDFDVWVDRTVVMRTYVVQRLCSYLAMRIEAKSV